MGVLASGNFASYMHRRLLVAEAGKRLADFLRVDLDLWNDLAEALHGDRPALPTGKLVELIFRRMVASISCLWLGTLWPLRRME
jgi:hypothetical protein